MFLTASVQLRSATASKNEAKILENAFWPRNYTIESS